MTTTIDVSILPAGPWEYMTLKYDDWGKVRNQQQELIADTCPGMNGADFSQAHPAYDAVRRAGPPESRAIAALLIWARSIIEPPAEVRAAMERLRFADECEHKIGVPSAMLQVADWQTVANWTLKIFAIEKAVPTGERT